ncbi:hypothetical protein ABIF94_003060 [Bradyrhizobium ottawaense]
MQQLNPNNLLLAGVVVILAILAVSYGYRLEISQSGLRFETTAAAARQ